MSATYEERGATIKYRAEATGRVRRDAGGHFNEQYQWSALVSNGRAVPLPADHAGFRQSVSLDPHFKLAIPDLRQAPPGLIAPVLDFMTFYADMTLAIRHDLDHPGAQVYVKYGKPNSWAAAQGLLLGEDSIDFDITLGSVDRSTGRATVFVRHVPPANPSIHLPAAWMRQPVAGTPNNWVEVARSRDGTYVASVGRETFQDVITTSLADGRIVSATMDNPVEVLERTCKDKELSVCGKPVRYSIRREISLRAQETGFSR